MTIPKHMIKSCICIEVNIIFSLTAELLKILNIQHTHYFHHEACHVLELNSITISKKVQDFNFDTILSGIQLSELLSTAAAGRYIGVTQLGSFLLLLEEKGITKSRFI